MQYLVPNFKKTYAAYITTMLAMNNAVTCDDNNISFAIRYISLYIDRPSHPSTVALNVVNASSL